jgi:hypothetical protein
MQTLHAEGISYNEIANTLNGDSVATKQGGTWRSQPSRTSLKPQHRKPRENSPQY